MGAFLAIAAKVALKKGASMLAKKGATGKANAVSSAANKINTTRGNGSSKKEKPAGGMQLSGGPKQTVPFPHLGDTNYK